MELLKEGAAHIAGGLCLYLLITVGVLVCDSMPLNETVVVLCLEVSEVASAHSPLF